MMAGGLGLFEVKNPSGKCSLGDAARHAEATAEAPEPVPMATRSNFLVMGHLIERGRRPPLRFVKHPRAGKLRLLTSDPSGALAHCEDVIPRRCSSVPAKLSTGAGG